MAFTKRDQILGPLYRRIAQTGAPVEWLSWPDHLRVNRTNYCHIKYDGRGEQERQFQYSPREQGILWTDLGKEVADYARSFVALYCKGYGVCVLNAKEWRRLLMPAKNDNHTRIYVDCPPGRRMRVQSSLGRELDHTIPKSRFPNDLVN